MTIIAARKLIANPGKTNTATERIKTASSIFAKHGAGSRVMSVLGGEGAGELHMYSGYDSVLEGAKSRNFPDCFLGGGDTIHRFLKEKFGRLPPPPFLFLSSSSRGRGPI